MNPGLVMYEEEFHQIPASATASTRTPTPRSSSSSTRTASSSPPPAQSENLDTTSLASLTAGNIAATGGMAKLLREKEFATQFHEGERENIHIQLVGNRVILVVIFDASELARAGPAAGQARRATS